MPTYEYKCKKCGHRFEKFQSIMAGPIRKCPECGKNAVERLISAGGGFGHVGSLGGRRCDRDGEEGEGQETFHGVGGEDGTTRGNT